MRLLIINILATAMLLFGAASAGAWSVTMVETTSFDNTLVSGSEIISINVYADLTGIGLQLFSVAVMYDPTILSYEASQSFAPSYILYSIGAGAEPTVYVTPSVSPHATWGGVATAPGPGAQVMVDFLDLTLVGVQATGLNVFLGTLVFHVTGAIGDGIGEIFLQADANGNVLRANDVVIPASSVGINGGIAVITPEPTTALLVGLGLIGLGVAGRRRA